ncbi:Ig domain-containing protein [Terriglobus saanensis]|uniref:Ig family protein n=1 Tax=Terriglobus saanensis (strain ATCC BAA-1853 / DSM 23119 / SP1PR4) TaxID=401053 RepID=E8UZX1_TERSS|nr:Ig domain-containing protein [Terriglobus saanensis]ADV81048.1 Ig family protein [Terriglobus saanensis SP1PR4]
MNYLLNKRNQFEGTITKCDGWIKPLCLIATLALTGCGSGIAPKSASTATSPTDPTSPTAPQVVALAIRSSALPTATINQPYSAAISVTGGTAPYTCSVQSGTLPVGLQLNGCAIKGTPESAAKFTGTIAVSDASTPAQQATGQFTLPLQSVLSMDSTPLPTPTVNTAYTAQVKFLGAIGSVVCQIAAGTIPTGLSFNPSTCAFSGTPTTAGNSSFTIAATDVNADTLQAPVVLKVKATPLKVLTASLPNPVKGVAYSQSIQMSGGVAPYLFALASGNLAKGLTLSTTGVISGTPTDAGATSFTLQVTDSEDAVQSIQPSFLSLVTYPVTPASGQLAGSYAFMMQSIDKSTTDSTLYRSATVGSFTADGNGLITDGELDANHHTTTNTSGSILASSFLGTYTVGAKRQGLITISTFNTDGTIAATNTYAIEGSAATETSTAALPADGEAGSMILQDRTTLAQGLTGSFALGLQGETPCQANCAAGTLSGTVAQVGQFVGEASGVISSGMGDAMIASTNIPQANLSGKYGKADLNGRVELTLALAGAPADTYPTHYAAYMLNAQQAFILSEADHSSHILLAGSAQRQSDGGFTDAALSGALLGYVTSAADSSALKVSPQVVAGSSVSTILRVAASGDGRCAVTNTDTGGLETLLKKATAAGTDASVISSVRTAAQSTGQASCQVSANGRGTLNLPVTSTTSKTRTMYLTAANRGYFLDTSYAALGKFEPQMTETTSIAAFDGSYLMGALSVTANTSAGNLGTITADGTGIATVTSNVPTSASTVSPAAPRSLTYTVTDATTGRFTFLPGSTTFYQASTGRFIALNTDPTIDSPPLMAINR